MKFIIGKKLEMTQVWQGDKMFAVTKIQVGPCEVVQVKNKEKDGYESAQLGYGEKKEKNVKKPQKGHFKGLKSFRHLKEFRLEGSDAKLQKGDVIDSGTFVQGDIVKVIGRSKGKGFQGVVKRHGFAGHNTTHGTKDQVRMPGSSGATGPAHVFKGSRMGGRMGGDSVTVSNLEIIEIDQDNNIISVKGAVPGARNGVVLVTGKGELKVKPKEVKEEKIEESKKEESVAIATEEKSEGDSE